MNTISKKMGFTQSQREAPVHVYSREEIIVRWKIKETQVMRKLPRMHRRFFVFKVLWDVDEYFYGFNFTYYTEMPF